MSTINKNANLRRSLRRAIQVALTGTVLASGLSHAVLRDHGPINTTTWFPDWYRDNNGLALGQCTFADDIGNGPMCLTGPADADPAGFPGNIGEEAFFATADIEIPINGGSFLWLGHLEMAYGSASGAPPAVRNANTPATEIVFSRERMRFDTPVTGTNACAGKYVIRTPFAVHEFDLEEGGRALFYTDDIQPVNGNYAAALEGHAGPFLVTDLGDGTAAGRQPVNVNNTPFVFTPPVGAPRKYIGDPNNPTVFWGSTLPVPVTHAHAEKGFNNFVEITPPAGCNLGPGNGVPVFEDRAAISGLIWDLPIADPTTVTKATYTRQADGTIAGLDVWASAPVNHNLVLTAADSDSQNLPSVAMAEEIKDGDRTGSYHAHLEFDSSLAGGIPKQVTVTNLSSNPVARDKAAVLDEVIVSKSIYDTNSKILCIAAHSADETVGAPQLRLEAPAYGAFGPQTGTCNTANPNDLVLEKNLGTDFGADYRIPPEGILVKSDLGGQETSQPSIIRSGVLDALNPQTADDTFIHVPGIDTTALNLVSGPIAPVPPSAFEKTAGEDNPVPVNYRIVVVSQPEIGTVTAPVSGGTVTYQAVPNMDASIQTFYYAIQDTTNLSVSNVARVDLSVDKVIPPPVGVPDQQAVFRTVGGLGALIQVTANDVTGLSSTPIDYNSIQIVQAPTRGTATPVTGGVNYLPQGQSGTPNNTLDTFTYTVANTAGVRSAPITVQVVLKSSAEAVAFQRVRWTGSRWDIRFTSSYAGSTTLAGGAGTLVLAPAAQCNMEFNNSGALGNIGGPVSPGAGTNAYVNTANSPAAVGNNWRIRCTTTSGGTQTRTGTL